MQRAVSDALKKSEDPDLLAESDAVEALFDFLRSQGVQDQERTRTKKLLCSRTYAGGPREAAYPFPNQDDPAILELEQDKEIAIRRKESNIKQQAWNRARTERLGTDSKEVRTALREELEPGFYISSAGKKEIRT